jgi:HK97 family phage prohead protease
MLQMPAPKTEGVERRALSTGGELRVAKGNDGIGTAAGYAVLWNNRTDIGGWWTEQFAPGCFTQSLGETDVVALHSHDDARPVGRRSRGTLRLNEDQRGLAFENDLPDTNDGRDLKVQLDRGDIEGMSFRFRARREEWDETVEPPLRTIHEADLIEITYTAFPAYPDTEAGMRSLEMSRTERRQHNKSGALARLRMRQSQRERKI